MKRILITGAGGPASVNFIRSIQIVHEKMHIVGTEANEHFVHLAPADKTYCVPRAEEGHYIDELNKIIQREKIQFLHAQPDVEVEAVSQKREQIEAKTFLPRKEAVEACQDKLRSAELWKKKNVPVAKFIEIRTDNDIDRALEQLGSPIWLRARHGAGGAGSTRAYNRETAKSWIRYWQARRTNWKFIAQEDLPGRNLAFHSLWRDGELLTSMARERLEYVYPHLTPSGITGTPAIQRTIHSEAVNKTGMKAVLAIDPEFNGIACVDLKEDCKGKPCVTEINAGRMFTTSFFFSYASKLLRNDYYANIPYLYVKLAFEESIPKIPKQNVLPANLYWIRHIDAPARLVKDGQTIGEMYYWQKQ